MATYLCVPIKGDEVFKRFVATSVAILIERPNMRFLGARRNKFVWLVRG